jgi:hypothetical protein
VPLPEYIATCAAVPLLTVPLPQSAAVPVITPVELTCRHCAPDPVIGSVTLPLVTAKFPFTVSGTFNVAALAPMFNFACVLFVPGSFT